MATPAADRGAVRILLEWVDAASEREGIAILDDEERARAERFSFERDRRRFVARRAFLRRVLAGYTGAAPASLRYHRSSFGKPELVAADGLTFSTSHAAGLAIVAVATHGEVGVDVERLRPMPDALDIARRFFAAAELEHLRSVPTSMRSRAFLRLWTRKEAYVKAVGRGLSMPLADFDVLERAVGRAAHSGDAGERPAIRLWPVEVPAGYVAALATSAANGVVQPAPMAMAS
jgi:4'-phosphopantetheinyl transferase